MTTAYNLRNRMYRSSLAGRSSRKDPGSGGILIVTPVDRGVCEMTDAGTRTLETAVGLGLGTSILCLSQTAAIVVAGAVNHTIGDGEWVEFVVTNNSSGAHQWVVKSSSYGETNRAKSELIPLNEFRIHDDFDAFLPETAATDDLGFIEGTHGTSAPLLRAITGAGATDASYGRIQRVVPQDYVDAGNLTLTIPWSRTDAAVTSITLDAEVVLTSAPGTDIQATAAIDVNSAASGTAVFTITGATVTSGAILDIRLVVSANDGGGGGDGTVVDFASVALGYTGTP